MKQKIKILINESIHWDLDTKTLDEAIEYLQELKTKSVDFDTYQFSWDTLPYADNPSLSLYGLRDETDKEEADREKQENAIKAQRDAYDKAEFERLKKKFGGK